MNNRHKYFRNLRYKQKLFISTLKNPILVTKESINLIGTGAVIINTVDTITICITIDLK